MEIMGSLANKAMRNVELSNKLAIRKERVSESMNDLTGNRLVVTFKKGAIRGEKHSFYVGTPLAKEVLDLDEKVERLKDLLPGTIEDFGDGISYILKYYFEDNVDVAYATTKTKKGRTMKLSIQRKKCGKDECEILCDPIVKAVTKKFGRLEDFERQERHFNVSLLNSN